MSVCHENSFEQGVCLCLWPRILIHKGREESVKFASVEMAAAYLDLKKKSFFTYHRVLLFNYDVQCRTPFTSYNRSMFSDNDIPKKWFTGPLTPANRKKTLSLQPLGGGKFSVFAKIEIGMKPDRPFTNKSVNNCRYIFS